MRDLDTTCPLDWRHPLNRGLALCLTATAAWRGGAVWRDLRRGGRRPNDGTLANGAAWSARSRPGGAGSVLFAGSGSSDQVTVADHASIDFGSGEFTVSVWAYASALAGAGSGNALAIKAEGSGSFAGWALRVVNSDGNPKLDLYPYNGGGVNVRGGTTIATGAWYHFVGLRRSGDINVYVNGVPDATPIGNSFSVDNAIDLVVGGAVSGWDGVEWDGYLDDLRLYSRALTDTEVARLYRESRAGYPNALRRLAGVGPLPEQAGGGGGGAAAPVFLHHYQQQGA